MSEIFRKLRTLRKQRGLTLCDVAEKVGTDHQHISRIERGKSRLTVDFLMKLATALETPVEELIEEPQAQPAPPQALESDLLGVILENVETVFEGSSRKLGARQKAALATLIYQHSFKAAATSDPELVQSNFIDCATDLLREVQRVYDH